MIHDIKEIEIGKVYEYVNKSQSIFRHYQKMYYDGYEIASGCDFWSWNSNATDIVITVIISNARFTFEKEVRLTNLNSANALLGWVWDVNSPDKKERTIFSKTSVWNTPIQLSSCRDAVKEEFEDTTGMIQNYDGSWGFGIL